MQCDLEYPSHWILEQLETRSGPASLCGTRTLRHTHVQSHDALGEYTHKLLFKESL